MHCSLMLRNAAEFHVVESPRRFGRRRGAAFPRVIFGVERAQPTVPALWSLAEAERRSRRAPSALVAAVAAAPAAIRRRGVHGVEWFQLALPVALFHGVESTASNSDAERNGVAAFHGVESTASNGATLAPFRAPFDSMESTASNGANDVFVMGAIPWHGVPRR